MTKTGLLLAFFHKFLNDSFFIELIKLILYPSDFGVVNKKNVSYYIEQFLDDIQSAANKYNIKITRQSETQLTKTLLNIRESYESVLTYKTVYQHITPKSPHLKSLIDKAVNNPLSNTDEFKQLKDLILSKIQAFYEIESISQSLISIDNLTSVINNENIEVFEAVKLFRDSILNTYNSLSKLQQINKQDKIQDYFVLNDDESIDNLSDTLVSYIFEHYNIFSSGYKFLDDNLEGLESSSVHIISAPSNHGKSIFMVNLAANLIKHNIDDFDEKDIIIFLTLEDDIYKLFRRFVSIFGNYEAPIVKRVFKTGSKIAKDNSTPESIKQKYKLMLSNIIKTSIIKLTNNKVGIAIKHSEENSYSPTDLSKFIDQLQLNGYNVKAVFADYIDVFVPTINRYSHYKDYDAQGTIVQELRTLSRQYKVPIITATQNRRGSENAKNAQTNDDIGDSIKKIRYADYVYMARQRKDLDIFTPPVSTHTIPYTLLQSTQQQNPAQQNNNQIQSNHPLFSYQDILKEDLVPFELTITKAKDGGKDKTTYLLFSKTNLRIYSSVEQYIEDHPILQANTKNLTNDLNKLEDMANFKLVNQSNNIVNFTNLL